MWRKTGILSLFFTSVLFFTSAFSSSSSFLSWFVPTTFPNCPLALPANHPHFCASFTVSAECHCASTWLPAAMCKDMKAIYDRMIGFFGSVQKACEYQQEIPTQNCIDSWNCYRSGGRYSQNKLCSGTGKACP